MLASSSSCLAASACGASLACAALNARVPSAERSTEALRRMSLSGTPRTAKGAASDWLGTSAPAEGNDLNERRARRPKDVTERRWQASGVDVPGGAPGGIGVRRAQVRAQSRCGGADAPAFCKLNGRATIGYCDYVSTRTPNHERRGI